jgi:hypothetical protein
MHRLVLALVSILGAVVAAGAQAPSCNLNGSGADELKLVVPQAGTDFDLGWKGKYHDLAVPEGATLDLCLTNCDTTTQPVCDVQGYAGGQSASGRAFAPPIPIVIGSVSTCVVTTFHEPFATGTANIQSGDIDVTANVSGDVYITTSSAVCPKCSGVNPGDAGTCQGGASNGLACTTDESIAVQNSTNGPYTVSRDCLPSGSPLSVAFSLTMTTGMSSLDQLCAGEPAPGNACSDGMCGNTCTGAGHGGISQNCCSADTTTRCFPVPLVRTGMASVPTAAWPDTSYPKMSTETIVTTFCAPAAPGLAGLAVNNAAGLPGPVAFILPVDAEWDLDSNPTSTTTTSTTTTSTTTTQPPPACTTDADCDDHNPCTDDTCVGGACSNVEKTGAAGAACHIQQATTTPICADGTDASIDGVIQAAVGKALNALQAFDAASAKKQAKLKKKADTALKGILKKLTKAVKKKKVSPDCGSTITSTITDLRSQVQAL